MTDTELLAHYRAKSGNPYMSLAAAKKMRFLDQKYAHLSTEAARRERERRDAEQERLKDLVSRSADRARESG